MYKECILSSYIHVYQKNKYGKKTERDGKLKIQINIFPSIFKVMMARCTLDFPNPKQPHIIDIGSRG